jgi:hypothetical protein
MASKIGKALGYSMDSGESPREKSLGMNDGDIPSVDKAPAEMDSDSDMGEDSEPMEKDAGRTAELLAMKQFQSAASPEDAVSAMKNFLEACGMAGGASY